MDPPPENIHSEQPQTPEKAKSENILETKPENESKIEIQIINDELLHEKAIRSDLLNALKPLQNSKESVQDSPESQKNIQNKQKGKIVQIENPVIKPIPITQKKVQKQDQSPESPVIPQTKKKLRQQLEIRRIPSELYESYDELLLTFNANEQRLNKDHIISPIKLKEKHNYNLTKKKSKQNQKSDESPKLKKLDKNLPNQKNKIIDEELLVSFPVIEGYCHLKTDNSQLYQTKYLMNKNTICFQTFKKIFITAISKIKLIEKDDKQITLKITYETDQNSKPQNFVINLLTESASTYFPDSYQFFSQIILRKLLLMKLYINELHEKNDPQIFIKSSKSSPSSSPSSSPLSSPMTLPSILPRKASEATEAQTEDQILLQSNLYKKSTFFNSWQKKYFTLTSKHLQSYSSPPTNDEKQKASTELSKTSEIWTRFELTYGYLVIKMWQSKIQKFQIGIPLCDYTNPEGQNNWLYGLSRNILWKKPLLKEQKINTTIAN